MTFSLAYCRCYNCVNKCNYRLQSSVIEDLDKQELLAHCRTRRNGAHCRLAGSPWSNSLVHHGRIRWFTMVEFAGSSRMVGSDSLRLLPPGHLEGARSAFETSGQLTSNKDMRNDAIMLRFVKDGLICIIPLSLVAEETNATVTVVALYLRSRICVWQ